MLLALLSLIAFQWYWIENAIAEKNEQFDRKVNETLRETARQIEKQEVVFLAKQRILQEEKRRLLEISKPQKRLAARKSERRVKKTQQIQSDTINFAYNDGNSLKFEPRHVITIHLNPEGIQTKNDVLTERMFVYPERQSEYLRTFLEDEHRSFEKFRKRSLEIAQKQNNILDISRFFEEDDFMERGSPMSGFDAFISEENSMVEIKGNEIKPADYLKLNNKPANKPNDNLTKKQKKVDLMKDVFKDFIIGKRSIY